MWDNKLEKRLLGEFFYRLGDNGDMPSCYKKVFGKNWNSKVWDQIEEHYPNVIECMELFYDYRVHKGYNGQKTGPMTKGELREMTVRKLRADPDMRPHDFDKLTNILIKIEGWEAPKRIEQKNLNATVQTANILDELKDHMKQISEDGVI
jgi:hypothetical protein